MAAFVFVFVLALGSLPLRPRPPQAPRQADAGPQRRARAPGPDDWPYTTRVLPWMLAGFLVMIFLIPFDAISLPIPIPMDGKFDRPLLIVLAALWFGTLLAVRGPGRPRVALSRVHVGVLVLFSVCSPRAPWSTRPRC